MKFHPQRRVHLWQGDCLALLRQLPPACIDAVITDPPYGTTAIAWDTPLDMAQLWPELLRVTVPRAPIVLFGAQPFTSALIMSRPDLFRYCWVWAKNVPGGFAQAKNKPLSQHEDIIVFSTGRTGHVGQCSNRMPYYPQGLLPYGKTVKNHGSDRASAFEKRPGHKAEYVQEFTNYPNSVLRFDVERGGLHPTQKPIALMEYLINTYTLPGQRVLDFTMGSGTTGAACKRAGRFFVGFEQDETYFNTAQKRITEEAFIYER